MFSLSKDPFASPVIPRFREFEINIVRSPTSTTDNTFEFITTLSAIHSIHPPKPVLVPRSAHFFNWETISDFEKTFPFASDETYLDIRNFMVAIYRIFSTRYLPYTLCRRNIKAPAHLTYQIWNFLNEYGLINSSIEESTRPKTTVPNREKWPELVYTVNDHLYTGDQYHRRIHPSPPNPALPIPPYHLLATPCHVPGKNSHSAEIPGLMTFGNWTPNELNSLIDQLKPQIPNPLVNPFAPPLNEYQQWANVAAKVGSKTEEECAAEAALLPVSIPTETSAFQLKNANDPSTIHKELRPAEQMIKEYALAENPELRLFYRAVHAVGNKKIYKMIKNQTLETPIDDLEAAGLLEMNKITNNMNYMKKLHKQRILKCMMQMIDVVQQSIANKKQAVDEAQSIRTPDPHMSESELSSDEKLWASATDDGGSLD